LDGTRLLTLVGPSGIGKSRLAAAGQAPAGPRQRRVLLGTLARGREGGGRADLGVHGRLHPRCGGGRARLRSACAARPRDPRLAGEQGAIGPRRGRAPALRPVRKPARIRPRAAHRDGAGGGDDPPPREALPAARRGAGRALRELRRGPQERLDAEPDNLLAAHRRTLETAPDIAARIGLALWRSYTRQGTFEAELLLLNETIAAARRARVPRVLARALVARARARTRLCRVAEERVFGKARGERAE